MADRWWGQAVYPSWWPSLTKDVQTEHEPIRMNEYGNVCRFIVAKLTTNMIVNIFLCRCAIHAMSLNIICNELIGLVTDSEKIY